MKNCKTIFAILIRNRTFAFHNLSFLDCMLNDTLKSQINSLWDKFWSGGMANPITAIEQISYLLFMRRLEDSPNSEQYFTAGKEDCQWSSFIKIENDKELFIQVRDKVFPFIQQLNQEVFSKHMKNAVFEITKPTLLRAALTAIGEIYLTTKKQKQQFQDIGDIYEYLLNEIARSGKNGQFRTPRHIIQMICELIDPDMKDIENGKRIGDPACGTSGFLLGSYLHILSKNTAEKHKITNDDGFHLSTIADNLTPKQRILLETSAFKGYDFDTTMVRFGLMNLLLHGITKPDIEYKDTLSKQYDAEKENGSYSIVLANPPFKGSIDEQDIHDDLTKEAITGTKKPKKAAELSLDLSQKTPTRTPYSNKTELLFLLRIMNMLCKGGRAAVIVPEGVLFGSTDAHKEIRKRLLHQCKMEAIIALPSGVFKPYAGVSTAILIFTKEHDTLTAKKATKQVWFYQLRDDGYELNDKRTPKWIDKAAKMRDYGDLHEVKAAYQNRTTATTDRKGQYFTVPLSEIENNGFDLYLNTYRQENYQEPVLEKPEKILAQLETYETEIAGLLQGIKSMISS